MPADFGTDEGVTDSVFGDRIRLSDDYVNGGNAGSIYQYMGPDADGVGRDLSTEDYSDTGYWKEVIETQLFPEGINVSESDSIGIGGLVVLNELRSSAVAYLDKGDVTADDVTIKAIENATIRATTESSATSSGGSAFGKGKSVAVNGTIATNIVLSQADAHISNSDVTTTVGDLVIDARNTSTLDAKTISTTTSGDTGVGVTLAFNTLGWESQNLLFNTIDALIGDPLIADAFGNQQPAGVNAYILIQ